MRLNDVYLPSHPLITLAVIEIYYDHDQKHYPDHHHHHQHHHYNVHHHAHQHERMLKAIEMFALRRSLITQIGNGLQTIENKQRHNQELHVSYNKMWDKNKDFNH